MSLIYQKMAWHLSLIISLKPNTYYDTIVILANKERLATVIEIIRMSNSGDTETTYGCRFVGISKEDQFKIEVYQIVDESKNN